MNMKINQLEWRVKKKLTLRFAHLAVKAVDDNFEDIMKDFGEACYVNCALLES